MGKIILATGTSVDFAIHTIGRGLALNIVMNVPGHRTCTGVIAH